MTFDQAKDITRSIVKDANTVLVTADGSVYIDSDIEAVEENAKLNNLEVFYVKPEKVETKKSKK